MIENVRDAFFNAVMSYNDTVTNPEKYHFHTFSHDELKGIFYNCLRRENLKIRDKRRWSNDNLTMDDFEVSFDKNLRIIAFVITSTKRSTGWVDCWSESGYPQRSDISDLRKISEEHPILYPTRKLNEMAQLINQIKT